MFKFWEDDTFIFYIKDKILSSREVTSREDVK